MPDDYIEVSPGSGKRVLVDQIGVPPTETYAQVMKIALGGDGVAQMLAATPAGGLPVGILEEPSTPTVGTGVDDGGTGTGSPKAIPTGASKRVIGSAAGPRLRCEVSNPSKNDMDLYINLNAAASTGAWTDVIGPGQTWWENYYDGEVYVYHEAGVTRQVGVKVL